MRLRYNRTELYYRRKWKLFLWKQLLFYFHLALSVTTLSAAEIGDTWVTLTWEIDTPPYSLKLAYHENGLSESYARPSPSVNNYTLTGLKPGTTYTVVLTPYSMLLPGTGKSISVETCGKSTFS